MRARPGAPYCMNRFERTSPPDDRGHGRLTKDVNVSRCAGHLPAHGEGVTLLEIGVGMHPCLSDQESGFRFGAGAQQGASQ